MTAHLHAAGLGNTQLRGLWLTCLTPYAVELAGVGAADWLGVDLQHGALTAEDLPPLLRVSPVPVLARLASHDPNHLARVIDTGVDGIIIPAVESATQAAALAAASHPPPAGARSTGVSRAAALGKPQPLLLPMIETAPGLAAATEIATTPGIDGLFIGPYDLALSLGEPTVTTSTVLKAIESVITTAHQHSLLVGAFSGNPSLTAQLPPVDLLAVDTDLSALRTGLNHLFDHPQQ